MILFLRPSHMADKVPMQLWRDCAANIQSLSAGILLQSVQNLIRLYAGVGAGKNGWAQKLAKEGNRVLLITSRANTADVQSKKLKAKRHLRLEDIMDANDSWGETALDHVSCTNSDIEKYVNEKA